MTILNNEHIDTLIKDNQHYEIQYQYETYDEYIENNIEEYLNNLFTYYESSDT